MFGNSLSSIVITLSIIVVFIGTYYWINDLDNPYKQTLFWFLANTFFGLLPIVITYYNSKIDSTIIFSVSDIIKQIVIPFYCISLSASAMIDFHISNIDKNSKVTMLYYIFPFIICILTLPLYQKYIKQEVINEDILYRFQIPILALTFLYCSIAKYKLFVLELEKKI